MIPLVNHDSCEVSICFSAHIVNLIFYLVGGLEHVCFFHIGNVIIPTDELIFFRGVGIPPTRIRCN